MGQTSSNFIKEWSGFRQLSKQLPGIFSDISGGDIDGFIMPFWDDYNRQLETIFLKHPPFGFLRNPIIKDTMFVAPNPSWITEEKKLLLEHLSSSELKHILHENAVGRPNIIKIPTRTSANTLHHAYHLYRFASTSGTSLTDIGSVAEWGGGYGNMAKIFKRINPGSTYTIIDTALFTTIQWLYLSSILPDGSVNLIRSDRDKLAKGVINLLPLKYLDNNPLKADLFASTWGLSESTDFAQDYVLKTKWFGAPHLLLGFQDSTEELAHASRLGSLAQKAKANTQEITFIPKNYYAIR